MAKTSLGGTEKTSSVGGGLQDVTRASASVGSEATDVGASAEADEYFPEGGLQAWLTVLGALLIQVCGFGYAGSLPLQLLPYHLLFCAANHCLDYYVRVYLANVSTSAISWIGSTNSFLVMACGLPVGRLYDHGYFYYLLWGGFVLVSLSLFMLSLAEEGQFYQASRSYLHHLHPILIHRAPQIFLAQGIATGLGIGMLYVPSMAALSHYFRRRQSFVMSIAASGSSLGAIAHTLMLNNTLDGLGFARATRAHAGLVSGLLLIACLLMRTRLPPPSTRPDLRQAIKRFSKDVPYVCAGLACSLFIMGMYFPLFYIQLDAIKHGINKEVAFYVLVIMNVCSFIGRFSSGFLIAPFGVPKLIAFCSACCAIVIFCMIAVESLAGIISVGATFGLFSGVYVALVAPLMASLASDRSEIGIRMGIGFTLTGFGGLCGTPIEGALLTQDYHWWRPEIFAGVSLLRRVRVDSLDAEHCPNPVYGHRRLRLLLRHALLPAPTR
ncbi:major facilitator superfamily domain-containing protein [Schizophyllum amplum]|uniref:Major facilitator superfamily domain-containing protein n=1 Tax=Schizophyllum amplum TaxID=97359 RepID=A0A550C5X4_9AGAR|nr:major facilitator superfamily domain-containing protein [Auriculariopsis ampla]